MADTGKRLTKRGQSERHRKLKSWFWQEMRRQTANRYQMALDEDYYDSLQWTPEEAQELLRRGQMPVAWNEVKPTIDWLIGTERRTRTDFKIIARNDDSMEAEQDAQTKTSLLKYLDDINRAGFERSRAFDDAVKAGLGWVELGVRGDPEQEPVFERAESWRNILYDSLGERLDTEDWRYIFRFRTVDLDVAKAYFKGNDAKLEAAAVAADDERYMEWWLGKRLEEWGGFTDAALPQRWNLFDSAAWTDHQRDRVMLIEAWTKEPYTHTTGQGAGSYDRVYMRTRCTVMTDLDILVEDWSPYRHNRFPFVPIWCYRRKRDGAPYGAVRPIRGMQDVTNKAMSKAIWEISSNQILIEKSALDHKIMTLDQFRDEMSAPDGVGVLADGGLNRYKDLKREGKVQGNLQIAEAATAGIRNSAGVTGENRGVETDAQSGRAILAKQDQGSLVTAEIFDNQLMARQIEGEIKLSLIEQYFDFPKIISVAGERSKYDYTRINWPDPESGAVLNDITQRSAQFVIGEQAWRQTLMQAMFESMMDLLGQLAPIAPNAVVAMLDSVLEMADIPNKQTVLRKVRQATGQPDPDAQQTPQEMAAEQRTAVMQRELDEARFTAELARMRADVKEAQARGEKLDAESLLRRVTAFYQALQAGQVVATVPTVAPVADEILRGAGFRDQGGQDPNIVRPPAQQLPLLPELQQSDGAAAGIETPRNDGVINA